MGRVARDLDDEGRLLWIPDAKIEAADAGGARGAEVLRPFLKKLAKGKKPEERLFGGHWRDWIRKTVRKVCVAAGVPVVTAHSMRGSHPTVALQQ